MGDRTSVAKAGACAFLDAGLKACSTPWQGKIAVAESYEEALL